MTISQFRSVPRCRLTGLEIASGSVFGFEDAGVQTIPAAATTDPLAALEQAVLPAVQRSPCVVSFSGGMDSSFVLAVATRVARREGLPEPIPMTWRFDDAPRAGESRWQEDLHRALSLSNWEILRTRDDLDLIGPIAQQILFRYGVVQPGNLHLHLPLIRAAAGGSILTGFGGDQILAGFPRPARTGANRLRTGLPVPVRLRIRHLRGHDPYPWLHRRVSRLLQRRQLAEMSAQPVVLSHRIAWHMKRRDLMMSEQYFAAVTDDHDVLAVHAFLDGGFHRALAGWDDDFPAGVQRAGLLDRMGRDVLPAQAWNPRPKARFGEVFLRRSSRDFAQHWGGGGVETQWVDKQALRLLWRTRPATVTSAPLIQQAWLASR